MATKTGYLVALGVAVVAAGAAVVVLRPHGPPASPPAAPPALAVPAAPVASTATADCLLPGPAPMPPDGYSAGAAEMQADHDAIQVFVRQLEAYQVCRNNQIAHAAPSVTPQQKQDWVDDGNAAVDQAHNLADAFSAQLKIFKARPPAP